MEFGIEIGDSEKHQLTIKRNWFSGRMAISVDAKPVVTNSPYNPATHVSLTLTHRYEFSVGNVEKHRLRVERERPLLFAGFRPHTYRVYVDDRLVTEIQSY